MSDARFEDAPLADHPLRLKAETDDDLTVISSLLQDAVGKAGDISWLPRKRRLAVLLNRFRWETDTPADHQRVRSLVTVESVLQVRARGLSPGDREQVYELLAVRFAPSADGGGTVSLTLAGGAEIAAEVECLELALADLTQPWAAHAPAPPSHGD